MPWTKEQRANHCRQIGSKGGRATYQKYGAAYYKDYLGPLGFDGMCRNLEITRAQGVKVLQFLKDPDRNVRQPSKHSAAELADTKAWVKRLLEGGV